MNIVLLVNFQDIENEDTVISFYALKIATKNKKQTDNFLAIFLAWETWKIHEISNKWSPPGLLSAQCEIWDNSSTSQVLEIY